MLNVQFDGNWPLVRTTALRSLPPVLRENVVLRYHRVTMRFAGRIADGIADGSLKPVDPMIASQVFVSTINCASDLRVWASRLDRNQAIEQYASSLASGLFDDPVS
jgi:hypothetical protein